MEPTGITGLLSQGEIDRKINIRHRGLVFIPQGLDVQMSNTSIKNILESKKTFKNKQEPAYAAKLIRVDMG